MPIVAGYERGVAALRRTVAAAREARIGIITAFAFSEENWKRPSAQIELLMALCVQAASGELAALAREGVRVQICGRGDRLPAAARRALAELVKRTAGNEAITLNLAVDYGARREIGDAVRALVREVKAGLRDEDSIDENAVGSRLYTAGLPDPDLIIRTGGELRLSNFLLFQAAYAEFWATETYWPDFGAGELQAALDDFAVRQRRYGT